jgi:signal peptidase II
MKHPTAFGLIALAGAVLDLLTKSLAFKHIPSRHDEVVIIKGLFSFGKTLNEGIVFGVGQGAGKVFLVVSILAVPVIVAIFWSVKRPRWVMTASLGLILAGTIGNMYDRIAYGAVRDFIKFYYGSHVWPLFNLADSCICVGVALLTVEMIFFDEKKKKRKGPEPAPAPAAPAPEPKGAP